MLFGCCCCLGRVKIRLLKQLVVTELLLKIAVIDIGSGCRNDHGLVRLASSFSLDVFTVITIKIVWLFTGFVRWVNYWQLLLLHVDFG